MLASTATFFSAPLVASFYGDARIIGLLHLLSVTFALSGLGIVQQALLSRDFAFRKLATISVVSTLGGAVVGISTALMGVGPKCLVFQSIVTIGITSLMLWISANWSPSLSFSFGGLRSIWSFSSNLVGYNILNYAARNGDNLLIGRFLGPTSLGYYTLGYNLLLLPLQLLSYSIGNVTFPAFATVQDDRHRMGRGFLNVTSVIASISFPLMFGFLMVCDVFVRTVYGPRWTPAVAVIAILVPLGALQSIISMSGSVYQATGRTDLQFKVGGILACLAVASFWAGLPWGIVGVATAYACVNITVGGYVGLVVPLRLLDLTFGDLLKEVTRPLTATAVMAASIALLRLSISEVNHGIGGLSVLIVTGCMSYIIASLAVNRHQIHQLREAFRREPDPPNISPDSA